MGSFDGVFELLLYGIDCFKAFSIHLCTEPKFDAFWLMLFCVFPDSLDKIGDLNRVSIAT
jgi:hypothetical protein